MNPISTETIAHMLMGAIIAGIGTWIIASLRKYLSRRVSVTSPVELRVKSIEDRFYLLVPAVNMLVENQGPILQALRALLEAQKGKINGNIESALANIIEAESDYALFKNDAAQIPKLGKSA